METWQDISSAPKDGRHILTWDGFDVMISAWIDPIGWEAWSLCAEDPILWMPLPDPPLSSPQTPEQTAD